MDAVRFDSVARTLRDGLSRRAVLRLGLGDLLAGVLKTASPWPAAAQASPYIYYAGVSADSRVQIGGAWFADVPPYLFVSHAPGGAAIGVHFILSAEVWLYEGTWQFLTTTPYVDCSPYEGGFFYSVSGYDLGSEVYTNAITIDVCGEIS